MSRIEIALSDLRKPATPPPALVKEQLRLTRDLALEDPVWAVCERLNAEMVPLQSVTAPLSPVEAERLDKLKDLLAISAGFSGRANSRTQAEQWAAALRKLVEKRDVEGASAWARAQDGEH